MHILLHATQKRNSNTSCYTQLKNATQTRNSNTQLKHATQIHPVTRNANTSCYTQLKHSTQTRNSNMQLKHATQTRNSNTQLKHSTQARNSNMQLKHILLHATQNNGPIALHPHTHVYADSMPNPIKNGRATETLSASTLSKRPLLPDPTQAGLRRQRARPLRCSSSPD